METTTNTKYAVQRDIMKNAHEIAKTLDTAVKYTKRLGQAIKMAWSKIKALLSVVFGIYDAVYSTLKKQDSIEFGIYECEKVGENFIAKKGTGKFFNIAITDEDNIELCRKEINDFLKSININIRNPKFSIK